MRVALYSCDARETNGWGSITLNLCRAYHAMGVRFRLYLPHSHPRLIEPWSEEIHYILPTDALGFTFRSLAHSFLRPPPDLSGFDVAHSLFSTPVAVAAARSAANRPQIPFVLGEQGSYAVLPFHRPLSRWAYRALLQRCDHFVTPSEFTRSLLLNFLEDDQFEKRTSVIANGVQYSRFNDSSRGANAEQEPAAFTTARWLAPRKVFLGVGGLKPRKGFDLSIRAIAPLLRERNDVVYRIVGEGPSEYLNHLKSLAAQESVSNKVEFAGQLRGEQLAKEFASAFAYLHLPQARNWQFEGFGIVYMEASAAGLPVVASLSGGVPSAVIHRETGLLSHEGDALRAQAHCKLLLEDQALYERLARGGITWAKQHDWPEIAAKFLALYRALIDSKKSV
jgi:glycosyltransferase involved in cell wall biosynthesis